MTKYYRVKKGNFLWQEGAILHDQEKGRYIGVEDIWDTVPGVKNEYISAAIIEAEGCAEFFERVYPDTIGGKIFYTKEIMVAKFKDMFKAAE